MRRRVAAEVAVVALGLGVLGASPAAAEATKKEIREAAREACSHREVREYVAAEFGVKANREQCQKTLKALVKGRLA